MGKNIVSKSNELIQMKLLKTNKALGLGEMKVANAIYSKIMPNDEDFKEYALTIPELAKLAGLDSKQLHKDIDRITDNLTGTVIKIQEPGSQDWLKAAVCITARYKAKDQCVYFKVAPDLVPYLLRLKESGAGFTQYYLEQTTNLQSKHALRLYELLRQFLPIKKVREAGMTAGFRRVSVDDLKGYLGIQNRYPKFAELRRAVLEPAQKELALKTDIAFDFTP